MSLRPRARPETVETAHKFYKALPPLAQPQSSPGENLMSNRNASLLKPVEPVAGEEHAHESNAQIQRLLTGRPNRRSFLAQGGLAASAIALAGCGEGNQTGVTTPPVVGATPSVADVLNFALNLEYLEATFYLTVTTGSGLPGTAMGTSPGAVTGGQGRVTFADPGVQALANQLAADEMAHVQFLRATIQSLGMTPVDMPALDLTGGTATPGTTDAQFLALARQLETTGVSAYEGAITSLVSNTAALTYAAQIHDTEGQHEGILRQLCIANQVVSSAVDSGDMPPYAPASGGNPATVVTFNTGATTGLNTTRNTSQVLMIVYGKTAAGVTAGGFFPNGVNGNIKST